MRPTRSALGVLALSAAVLTACSSGGGAAGAAPGSAAAGGSAASVSDTAAVTPAAADAKALGANWPTFHGNRARTGVSTSMPAVTGTPTVAHKVALDGAVYASPLVVGGHIIVATEHDSVYALSSTGSVIWHRKLGTPAPQSQLPCGDIFPLGITGTPTYDSATGLVYVVAEYGSSPRHQLVALHASTGKISWHRIVDLPGVTRAAMQQRGALTINGSHVYVPFGGLAGDCGAYKGRVEAISLTGSHAIKAFTVPTAREGGIWATPGPVRDASGHFYVAVGNGASGVGDSYDHSDSVIELRGVTRVRSFSPTTWASDNDSDLDLGSQSPALIGKKYVFIAGKSGEAYVLRQNSLGGIGGQVSKRSLCASFGGTVVDGSTVYVPCTDGVQAIKVSSTGTISKIWRASSSITGSPVMGGGKVWALDPKGGILHELSPSTGSSVHSLSVGATSRFATPAISGTRLIVPTLAGVTIVAAT